MVILYFIIGLIMNSPAVAHRIATVDRVPKLYKVTDCEPWADASVVAKTDSFYQKVKESITTKGIINPLLGVNREDKIAIILGNTRLQAAQELDLPTVPVIVINDPNDWEPFAKSYKEIHGF